MNGANFLYIVCKQTWFVNKVQSYKMDLDFWGCFEREIKISTELHKTDLGLWVNLEGVMVQLFNTNDVVS